MGRVTSKDNEAKSKMKHPQICPRWDSNKGGSDLWSNTLLLDNGGILYMSVVKLCLDFDVYDLCYLFKKTPNTIHKLNKYALRINK